MIVADIQYVVSNRLDVGEVSEMTSTVAELTAEQLRAMIEEIVREQLADILGDPDEGLELRPEVVAQLREQMRRVRSGEEGVPLSDIPRPSQQ